MGLPDLDQYLLNEVVALVRDVLGSDAIGAYLFGSAVTGGLRHDSDLDILVVSRRPTTPHDKRRLIQSLLSTSGQMTPQGRLRRAELTIVVQSEVKPWRYPPRLDFQYGDWWRPEFESGVIEPWETANPDLSVLITMTMLYGKTIFGPPPTQVFDPISRDDLVRAMVDGISGLQDDLDWDTRNVILTFARIWSTVATGVIRSKDAAADWALERLPEAHRAVLARARAIYLGDAAEQLDDLKDQVHPFAEYVVGEIHRSLP
jgi:predicted nucleotidyltransferase